MSKWLNNEIETAIHLYLTDWPIEFIAKRVNHNIGAVKDLLILHNDITGYVKTDKR